MPIKDPRKITPGQGLLKLIRHYQDEPATVKRLKQLYINGAHDEDSGWIIWDLLLNDPLLQDYELAIEDQDISADPTRRYFETHLAEETLKHQLAKVNLAQLQALYDATEALIDPNISERKIETISEVLAGRCLDSSAFYRKQKENTEFTAYIRVLREGRIFVEPTFSEEDREKILWLVATVYLGMVNVWTHTPLPLNLYDLQNSFTKRGKIMHSSLQFSTRSQHFGLIKSYDALSLDDSGRSAESFSHPKPSQYAKFDSDSSRVQECFTHLVHPFSNSISGVSLLQCRVLARLHADGGSTKATQSLEAFIQHMRLVFSSLLFYGGGHSFYEYAAVLKLPEIQAEFQYISGFSELTLESMFYQDNEQAFDTAIEATLTYYDALIERSTMHAELSTSYKTQRRFFKPQVSDSPTTVVASEVLDP
ncbi:MAG: hypothetical protein NXI01_02175 [Gammaproteobacteria bacterium]|nr:hypothetical protein [Gammaproteobacteria bacterium]